MTTKAQAFGLFLQEKYSEALDAFRALVAEDFSMHVNTAVCAANLGQPDWKTTDLLLDNQDRLPAPAFLYLAEIFLVSENAPQALKFIDRALALDPNNVQAYLTRIDILETLGDGDEVLKTVDGMLPRFASDERALCLAAGYAAHYGQIEKARYLLKKALKINRLYTIFQEDFYDCFQLTNHEYRALAFAKEAAQYRPNAPEILYVLATASALTGATDEADAYFRKLSENYDVLPDRLKSMWADALFGSRQYVRAFDMAHSVSPDYPFKDGIRAFMRKALYLMTQDTPDAARERAKQWRGENPDDAMITHYCAAVLGEKDAPAPPPVVAQNFFDAFAADFDTVMVDNLNYKGDALLDAALTDAGIKKKKFKNILDAGCGTGLLAPVLKQRLKNGGRLVGVDVSGLMLDEARKKIVYTDLVQQDIVSYCSENADAFDFIACMDVSSYFGDLTPLFTAFHTALKQGGTAVFSILTTNGDLFALQTNGQYKHSPAFVATCLNAAGLTEAAVKENVLRLELGEPEKCLVFRVVKK